MLIVVYVALCQLFYFVCCVVGLILTVIFVALCRGSDVNCCICCVVSWV